MSPSVNTLRHTHDPLIEREDGDLRGTFVERGYLEPVPLFSREACETILAALTEEQGTPLDWSKGSAATSSAYYALATHDGVLDLVTRLMGDDVLLWGASLLSRGPGEIHPWHTDIESSSPESETLSVWIGLAHTTEGSSLKVLPSSHRFGVALQQVSHENGVRRDELTDTLVARWAAERGSPGGVVSVKATDGDVVVFDGRLWHGSHNLNRRGTRYAALLQYATPRTPIRIPNFNRLEWPFEYQTSRAPCIVVSGRDVHGLNRLVAGPTAVGPPDMSALTTRVHALQLPLEQDPEVGWKPHPLFRGGTPNIESLGCHASVLDPGCEPHPPHRHDEEEILIVLDGEATLVLEESRLHNETSCRRARRGTFAYYPAGFTHTIRNSSDAPISYVMFKWSTGLDDQGPILKHHLIPLVGSAGEPLRSGSDGFQADRTLEGETRYLRKLHSHVTTLQPGAGYAPHVDAHDVAIVVLEGTVESLGEEVGPDGVIFYAAGESHGMRNVGDVPAVYLVFEFHGRHSLDCRSKARGLGPDTRDRVKRKAIRVARSLVRAARRRVRIR
jgi:quercetin dioxygenase-like cupin family protein